MMPPWQLQETLSERLRRLRSLGHRRMMRKWTVLAPGSQILPRCQLDMMPDTAIGRRVS